MIYDIVLYFILVTIGIVFSIVASSVIVSFWAWLNGRYLNRYFIIKKFVGGIYTLHHAPVLGYYYASEHKYGRLMNKAVKKFQSKYPDTTLIGMSITLQSRRLKGVPIQARRWHLLGFQILSDFVVLLNLANYRSEKGKFRYVHLIRNIHRTVPMKYVIVDKGVRL